MTALDREIRATAAFPDILVHERNTDANNIVVLELKKPGEDIAYDELKLQAFREELGYVHTALRRRRRVSPRGNLGR